MPLHPSIIIAAAAFFFALTSAQPPVPVCCMAYAQVGETALYVQGGLDSKRVATSQFVALNLTAPFWNTSSPPWFNPPVPQLPFPPPSSYHSMAVAMDRRCLYVWTPLQPDRAVWSYTIVDKYWVGDFVPLNVTRQPGIRIGVDLTLGDIYIPAAIDNGTQMMKNTPNVIGVILKPMPTSLMPVPVIHDSFVWSTYRNSFLHYGGRTMVGNTSNPYLIELLLTSEWVPVKTNGTSPGDVSGHCMVPAYGGQNMIVFGGAGLDGIAKTDIYILDLPTSTWTTGKPADASQARTNMACAVAGDNFIAWGGESGEVTMDAVPIVYDIRNNEWTTQFKLNTKPGAVEPSTLPIAPAVSSIAVIGGRVARVVVTIALIGSGIAAVVVTMALIGIFYYRRRVTGRKRMSNISNKDTIVSPSVREPQDPVGDPKAELLGSRQPSSPPPLYYRPMPYDQDEFFRLLAASPLAGPHAFLKDPQGEQHRPTSRDVDELEGGGPSNGSMEFSRQQSSSSTAPRSPQLVDRASTALQNWSSNGYGDDSEETAQLNPRSSLTAITDEQGGPLRAPQWQPLLPIASTDQKQNVDRSQELVQMMNAIRAEQIELEKSVLVQDALAAQVRAAYPDAPQSILLSNKK
ncbi:hypothetical protein BGZ89_000912 [Linnemannia elongata]|nr:hypothetical protein BGZ89_000912 [Linnemannia elongata]